jgi:RNA polymerase sigma factor (sigma-70 family)
MMSGAPDARIEDLLRDLAPQVLGALVRRFGDLGAAEDAVQEALVAGALAWPRDGLPDEPRAWLIRVAFRRLTDQLRSERARRQREDRAGAEQEQEFQAVEPELASSPELAFGADADDTLRLLCMCCHPALTEASAIALTLRAVGGLTTAEIAKAFLVPEATLAQRISRAKQTIRQSSVPFQLPAASEWSERLGSVLHVLYLIFNEGYTSSIGPELARHELSNEAIRLTRAVSGLRPEDSEVTGLLALMLLTDARRRARTGPDGELVALADQDRALWDSAQIAEGVALISAALSRGAVGPYQLQAAIAALHDEAARVEETDWPQILALYGLLERMLDNPMVMLNRAIALAMVQGPAAGLARLVEIERDGRLSEHHRLSAVRAHLLERAGQCEAAIEQYRRAAEQTTSLPERRYLLKRADQLSRSR